MITITDAILSIDPNAKVSIIGDEIDTAILSWKSTEISKADIKTKMDELKTAYNNNAYARKRKVEYPNVQDFMEAYTEKEIGGNDTKWNEYKTKYNKVRTDNPKE
jgi:hypothetical protein